ncbi:hypothetical protein Zmor_018579 [Zophobas morio]|uniref:Uncharacterized protein n=1 Tax=Zophobas morio TaxID=2755281 RepID=A0AA38IE93_9CUCU|nr:hypothetical protein Zmor_018579 [Zophobas morio]
MGFRMFEGTVVNINERNITVDICGCKHIGVRCVLKNNDKSVQDHNVTSNTECHQYEIVSIGEEIEIFQNTTVIKKFHGGLDEINLKCYEGTGHYKFLNNCPSGGAETRPCNISCPLSYCHEILDDLEKNDNFSFVKVLDIILIILGVLITPTIIYFCYKHGVHCPRSTSDHYKNFRAVFTRNSGRETTFVNPPEDPLPV